MSYIMNYVVLVLGFALLAKGADYFVEGAAAVAKKMRVPAFIIGMTIVAMGTSSPECAVSVTAALKHNNELAVSNVVGSNIFNLMFVCGFCALITPIAVEAGMLKREYPFSVFVTILLLVTGLIGMSVGRVDGIIMLVVFVLFLYFMVKAAKKAREGQNAPAAEEEEIKDLSPIRCLIYIIGGLIAVIIGGDCVVDAASVIAESFGMSQNLIGLTVVAFGTSLPELVTSLAAAKKKQVDMALGNVIGSNIFNILLIIGLAAVISPISFNMENVVDLIVLIAMSLEVYLFARKDYDIRKSEGVFMLAGYIVYMVYICLR